MATKRIAVLGGPRCGKTTLIQHLYVEMKIAGLNVGYALEYSTDYLKDKGMIETISEQYGIYLGQKRIEDELSTFDYALTDYATFVPYIYGRFMLGNKERSKKEIQILKDLYCLAIEDIQNYDTIIYVPREFGYVQDGVRWQDEEIALKIDEAILSFLKAENVNFVEVKGSTKERAKQILELLDIKYQDTPQLDGEEK
ncbi:MULTISPECIES: AAA family ATPase [Romboutsia]|uniref:Conserved domain protein n=1 Tax=Romboutsia hominis TaxID=1507512 RepID=A0A2P2BUR6_9FIRM|nr:MULTISPECIES: ATP-binding protein [Romboutsia]MCH1959104.1 ATP-binding protein [Romboutsia hominis]MCH1968224.1 ATP-binding protein [Romboutsia hominis]MDB8789469.1 ATP-binding protein [Romboutsia sp. 1001216sp1]MDB8793921.1 ATP-binding protein [Romboutsia sp. 1001216sp1]MDB8796620.1 ATP-binding protein [Romboutsia sp. 1001216sp1]